MNISKFSQHIDPAEARSLQCELRDKVKPGDDCFTVRRIAGLDVGIERHSGRGRAAAVVLTFPELELLEQTVASVPLTFPYVPGLLSFREAPALLKVLERLRYEPDVLMCDGQGIAHPRRFGLACHLGVITDKPSIGVAKSRLIGRYREPQETKGARQCINGWRATNRNGVTNAQTGEAGVRFDRAPHHTSTRRTSHVAMCAALSNSGTDSTRRPVSERARRKVNAADALWVRRRARTPRLTLTASLPRN